MTKALTAVWLGDGDPNAQFIRMGDLAFVKGEKVSVPADHEFYAQIKDNPTFSTEGKADVVEAEEPSDDEMAARLDEGTEKGALKAELAKLGVKIAGNPSVETLRNKLADAAKA